MPPPPSSSANGGRSSQSKQSTLLGFFGKPTAGPIPSPSQRQSQNTQQPGSKSIATKAVEIGSNQSNLIQTPPPSVQKKNGRPLQSSSSLNAMQKNVDQTGMSSSPLRSRSDMKSGNNGLKATSSSAKTNSSLEMTPPSSSPPITNIRSMEVDNDDDDDEMITRPSRRRASAKRQVNYVESDDEFGGDANGNGDNDDDDTDQYKPESDRPSKKARTSKSDDEFDDEFDDFIVPDEELEEIEKSARKTTQKPKQVPHTVKSTSINHNVSNGKSSSTFLAPPTTRRPMSTSSSSNSLSKGNGSKAQSSDEEPYEFLTRPMDENKNVPTHPDYDKRTLFIPEKTLKTLTPFEKQFWNIKRHHNDTVLFFQKGKFYELYEDDAVIAHREFGLKMTDRVRMKMAGVPESSFTTFANKFLALGYKVGRVDQCETAVAMGMRKGGTMVGKGPVTAGGDDSKIVRRELKHIYTNGTIVDADCLPDEMSSFCVSIKEVIYDPFTQGPAGDKDDESLSLIPIFGVCFLDASTAEFKMRHFEDDVSRTKLETLLRSSRIKEVIHEKGGLSRKTLRVLRNTVAHDCNITMLKPNVEFLDAEQTLRKLNLVYNPSYEKDEESAKIPLDQIDPVDVSILPEGIKQIIDKPEALSALGAMLIYLTQLNLEKDICASKKFDIFDPEIHQKCMLLDAQSLTHLNVLMNEQGETQGTLLNLVNRAVTPFGKRLMRIWLLTPLAQIDAIVARQEAVEELIRDSSFREDFDIFAKSLPDIERIMPRIYAGNCKSRDFAKVLKSLAKLDENIELFTDRAGSFDTDVVKALLSTIPSVSHHAREIQSKCQQSDTIEPRKGVWERYDEAEAHLDFIEKSLDKELVKAASIVKLPRDRVNFKSIGTNEIYQIEVPIKTKVPDNWALVSQTQSMKRYYSPEVRQLVKDLKEGRETKLVALKEFQASIFEQFQSYGDTFLLAVKGVAEMDCLLSLAKASYAMGEPSCRPEFVESETAILDFEELRHPCLASTSSTEFIANDISLGGIEGGPARVTILTGGNMAGKSTTARTTATAVILAQLGCRVPASRARLSPIDRIASRMGANDQLFRNNSTFMVEMLEASRILKDCTPRSLVIMDELGRGTSTFDGQAIAYAVLHHLIGRTRCLCFFLTHYTSLAHEFEGRFGVANKHMEVLVDSERREVVFTYKLVKGIAESSYGTEVAALAGVPLEICDRATRISKEFADATKKAEAERLQKLGNSLTVATLSDFSLIFKSGMQTKDSQKEDVSMDDQALSFMRQQISAVMEMKNNSRETTLSPNESGLQISMLQESTPFDEEMEEGDESLRESLFSDDEDCETNKTSTSLLNPFHKPSDSNTLKEIRKQSKKPKKAFKQSLEQQQLTLDLGQKIRIDCKDCGMSFDKRDEKDVEMHTKFHSSLIHGMEFNLRKPIEKGAKQIGQFDLSNQTIRLLQDQLKNNFNSTSKSPFSDKQVNILSFNLDDLAKYDHSTIETLQNVLTNMNSALGSVSIDLEEELMNDDDGEIKKLIIAIYLDRIVGSALIGNMIDSKKVFRISNEFDQSIMLSKERDNSLPDKIPLAIHRIHIIPLLRRSGIASAILDAALNDCIYGLNSKEVIRTLGNGSRANVIAFSQPTESGRLLAEKWINNDNNNLSKQNVLVFQDSV